MTDSRDQTIWKGEVGCSDWDAPAHVLAFQGDLTAGALMQLQRSHGLGQVGARLARSRHSFSHQSSLWNFSSLSW